MGKKLVFGLLTVVLLCSLLFMAPACAPAEEKITLTAISAWPIGDHLNIWYEKWIEEVNSEAEGELEINFIGGPEVVSAFEAVDVVSRGIYDIVATPPGHHYGLVPEGTAHVYATYFVDPAKIRETGLTARLDEIYREKAGVTWLGAVECNEMLIIFPKKVVTGVADLQGMKCRSVPGWVPLFEALGMVPTSIPKEELYEAFEKGIVHAVVTVLGPSPREQGITPLAGCMILPSLPQGSTVPVVMHAERFDALPKHLQKLMVDAIKKTEVDAYHFYGKATEDEIGILEGMGVKKVILQGAERDSYLKKTAKAQYDKFLADCPEYGPELLNMIKDYMVKVD